MKKIIRILSLLALVANVGLVSCEKEYIINHEPPTGVVIVMDTDMVSSKLKEISSNGTLTFDNLSAKDTPKKGDIICTAPSKSAPQGFLYKVKEIRKNGTETTIVTEMATIEEAVEEAYVNQTFDLTFTDIIAGEGVEILEMHQMSNSQLNTSHESLLKSNIEVTAIQLDVKIPVTLPNNNTAYIQGKIGLKAKFNCEMNFDGWALKQLELTVQPQFTTQLKAIIESNTIKHEIPFHIFTYKCAPITVWAGVVPIVFVPELSIDAILTIKGEIKVQATLVDWDYSYSFGCGYNNGKFYEISKNTSKPAKYLEDVQLILSGELKLEPTLSYMFKLYNTDSSIGVLGDFFAKLEVNDSEGTDVSNIKISLSCGLEFGAKAELKIFSKEIGEWKLTFGKIEWIIWEKFWGLTDDIENLVPPEIFDALVDLEMPIFGGNTPPDITGTFLISPVIKLNSNFFDWSGNSGWADYILTFYEQDFDNQTVKIKQENADVFGEGIGGYVVGTDNDFTIFTELDEIDSDNVRMKTIYVYSGTMSNDGIRNFHMSLIMKDDGGDPYNRYIENGQGRLFYDGDGFSERITGSKNTSALKSKMKFLPTLIYQM